MDRLNMTVETGSRWSRKLAIVVLTAAYLTTGLAPAYASDTEVYARKLTGVSELTPTLMMLLQSSKSMENCLVEEGGVCKQTRFQAMFSAMQKVLFGSVEDNVKPIPGFVRLGFARYNPDANKGGWVKYPARPLDALAGINPSGLVEVRPPAGSSDASQLVALNLTEASLALGGLAQVGLRFAQVNLPKGATINEAYIEFTASKSSTAGTAAVLDIDVHDVGDAPVFATGANDIVLRPYTAVGSVKVTDDWVKDEVYRVDVRTPVSYLVNRADWCGGQALALRIRDAGGTGTRDVYSFEGSATKSPRLVVNYSVDPSMTNSCVVAPFTATSTVTVAGDDIEYTEGTEGGAVTNNSELRFAVVSGGKRRQTAIRFSSWDREILPGAQIDEAFVTGVVFTGDNNPPSIQATAFNTDNLAAFCSGGVCKSPTTGVLADTLWSPGKLSSGSAYAVPLTAQVKTIVAMPGWKPTNAIGIRLRSSVTNKTSSASFTAVEAGFASRNATLTVKGRQKFTDLSKLKTVREEIWEELQAIAAEPTSGGTPQGAGYAETMRYMLGLPVYADKVDPRVTTDASNTQYNTPIKKSNQCSGNYVFALADGDPPNLAQVNTNVSGIVGSSCDSTYKSFVSGGKNQTMWSCMFQTAEWALKPTNQVGARIRTNTVLFGDATSDAADNVANMKQTAKFGGGAFYKAGDEGTLVQALVDTVNALLDVSGTITAPGVAVNQLNRLNNLDQLFYAVFDPDVQKAFWPGNVKRYRLDIANELVLDVNSKQAVDPATSFFKSDAQSWWSPAIDGDKARLGGAASVLPHPESRKLFTYTGALPAGSAALTPVDLGNAGFVAAGKAVTGIADDNAFKNLVNWYKGYQIESLFDGLVSVDSTTLLRNEIGGALHSRPILVSYGYSGSASDAATNAELQDNTVFFSTLEGTLHAIDAKTGKELFGFIPGEKLAVLPKLFLNPNQENPEFGMDLTWSVFRKDGNGDGKIGAGDKVYIYGGMRMGGRNYYALDVTDRTTPKLLFAIRGGSGAFAGMGQTWSQPVTGALKVNGTVRNVLVFGGGYDPQHETENVVFTADTMGNQLYIVDAETGALIWSASNSGATMTVADMKFSVPMAPKPVDINADGLIDHIYFADLGGQVFRVDVDNGNASASTLVKRVRKIASLAGGTVATQRRFYEPPTVALFADPNGKYFAGVGLGSGYRSHPLSEATTDHFFVLFDYDVPRADILTATTFQDEINMSKLAEAEVGSSTIDLTGKLGWYLDFSDVGEKVITSGVFFRNTLIFSSYVPSVEGGDSCSPVIGRSKLYSICVLGGALCGNSETAITVKDNAVLGLGGDPQMIFLPDPNDPTKSNVGIITGTDVEKFGEGVAAGLRRTRWMEKTPQN